MIVLIFRSGSRHYDYVQTTIEPRLVEPVTLADQSLDPVPHDAVAHLLTDRYADPVPVQIISTHIQDKISVHIRFSGAVTFPEIIILFE